MKQMIKPFPRPSQPKNIIPGKKRILRGSFWPKFITAGDSVGAPTPLGVLGGIFEANKPAGVMSFFAGVLGREVCFALSLDKLRIFAH